MAMRNPARATAYSILAWRDGLRGWQTGRRDFRRLAASSAAQVRLESDAKLAGMVRHAFETVPHYRELWTAAGFRPPKSMTADQLTAVPVLSKDTIRAEGMRLASTAFRPEQLDREWTSGTTHARTEFFRDHECTVARFGRQWGILEQCGHRPGDRTGLVWGMRRDVLPSSDRRATLKSWFRQFAWAHEVFYCGVMNRQDMRAYLDRLRTFQPIALYGYPSAFAQFAALIEEERLAPLRVARIFCTAEPLREAQRSLLERVFGGAVFSLYCTREHGCIGFECDRHDGFHVDAGSVCVEILENGRPVPAGESGEVVVTDLLNHGMPLIRNSMGDVAALSERPCPCGSPLPLLSRFGGRLADNLHRRDGTVVVGHLLSYMFTDLPAIRRTQFVQNDPGLVEVYVVCEPSALAEIEPQILQRVGAIMGPGVSVRAHGVADIARNPGSGKFQEVVCRIQKPTGLTS
jgi:phenylacetate-CoA ligase